MSEARIVINADGKQAMGELERLKASFGKSMGDISGSAKGAMGVLGGLATGLGAISFAKTIKGAIDAADEMGKMAQKVGINVEQVAGLQLAFQQSGLGAEAMQKGLTKLAIGIAEGNKALDAMGIASRNSDGSLKTTREVLGSVADKFAEYGEGADKTALAVRLFGKAGADMIPLLNGGAAALDEFDDTAKRLGLTMDKTAAANAEKFNDTMDLVGMGVQGVARQVTAQLLPTLTGLAGQFLESATSGDRLKNTAGFLSSALKVLYIGGLGIIEAFSSVGKVLGGVAAAVVAALTGDFGQASNILKDMVKDVGAGFAGFKKDATAAWNATGSAAVDSMASTVKALKGAAPTVSDAAAGAKKLTDEFAKLRDKITGKDSGTDSDFIENLNLLKKGFDSGRVSLQDYLALANKYVAQQKYSVDATKAEAEAAKLLSDFNDALVESERNRIKQLEDGNSTLLASNLQVREEIELIGLSERAQFDVTQARLASTISIKEEQLARLQNTETYTKEFSALEEEIRLLKERASLQGQKFERGEEFKKLEELRGQSKQFTDDLERGLTDSLFRAFESGKGFFSTLWSGIKNLFKTTALKLIVNAVVGGVGGGGAGLASAATSLLGGGSGGGLGGIGNLLGSGISSAITGGLSAGFGGLTGTIGSLFGAAGTGATIGGALSAGSIALGAGNIVGGLSTIVGALGPIALGIGAVASLLMGKKDKRFGSQYAYTGGATQIVGGPNAGVDYAGQSTAQDAVIVGINSLLRRVGSSQILAAFDSGFESSEKGKGFSYAGGQLATGVKFGQGNGTGYLNNRGSKTPDQALAEYKDELLQATLQALQAATDLPKTIADSLSGVDIDSLTGDALKNFAASIDKQITDVETFRAALNGLPFENLRDLGFDVAAGLLAAGGGIEVLSGNLSGYFQNYFSEEEQRAQKIKDINAATAGTGFDAATATRETLKGLIQAADPATEAGRKTIATLLSVQGAFADLTSATGAAGTAASERATLQEQLNALTDTAAQALTRQRDALDASNRALFDQVQAAKKAQAVDAEKATLQDQLNALTDTSAQALARQRDALDASNRALFDNVQAEKARQAEVERLKGVATQRGQLDIQIMQLQGNTAGALAAQRAIELAEMDATLRPLQMVIYGLQDLQTAAAAAAAAANRAADLYFAGVDRGNTITDLTAQGNDALDQIFGSTQSASSAAVDSAKAASDAAKNAAQTWAQAANTIRSALDSIRLKSLELRPDGKDALFAQFQALTTLVRGGDTESVGKLTSLADSYLTVAEGQATSLIQVLRERAKIESSLQGTLQVAEAGVSVQESIAAATGATAAGLERANVTLTGFAADLRSVLNAGYAGAGREEAGRVSGTLATATADFANYFRTTQEGASRAFAGGTLTRLAGDNAQFTAADGRVDFIRATDSILGVSSRISAIGRAWQEQYGIRLPGFAMGGMFGGGLRIVGENGPELEATGPSRIFSAQQTRQMLNGGGSNNTQFTALVTELIRQVGLLTEAQKETRDNTKDSADVLKRVTQGRNSIATKEAA